MITFLHDHIWVVATAQIIGGAILVGALINDLRNQGITFREMRDFLNR